jgi:hypothetical protein
VERTLNKSGQIASSVRHGRMPFLP